MKNRPLETDRVYSVPTHTHAFARLALGVSCAPFFAISCRFFCSFLPRWNGNTVQKCALKFCPVAEMDDLKNEIGMQCLSKHPNIVTLREAFVTKTEVGGVTGRDVSSKETEVLYCSFSDDVLGLATASSWRG